MFSKFRNIFSKSKNDKEQEPDSETGTEKVTEIETVNETQLKDASEVEVESSIGGNTDTKKLVQNNNVTLDPTLALQEDIETIKPGTVITLENSIVETEIVDVVELIAEGKGDDDDSEVVETKEFFIADEKSAGAESATESESVKTNVMEKKPEPKTVVTVTLVKTEKIAPTKEEVKKLQKSTTDFTGSNTSLNVQSTVDSPRPIRAQSYELLREPLSYVEKLAEVNLSPILKKKSFEKLESSNPNDVPVIKDTKDLLAKSSDGDNLQKSDIQLPAVDDDKKDKENDEISETEVDKSAEINDTTTAVLTEEPEGATTAVDKNIEINETIAESFDITDTVIVTDILNSILEEAIQEAAGHTINDEKLLEETADSTINNEGDLQQTVEETISIVETDTLIETPPDENEIGTNDDKASTEVNQIAVEKEDDKLEETTIKHNNEEQKPFDEELKEPSEVTPELDIAQKTEEESSSIEQIETTDNPTTSALSDFTAENESFIDATIELNKQNPLSSAGQEKEKEFEKPIEKEEEEDDANIEFTLSIVKRKTVDQIVKEGDETLNESCEGEIPSSKVDEFTAELSEENEEADVEFTLPIVKKKSVDFEIKEQENPTPAIEEYANIPNEELSLDETQSNNSDSNIDQREPSTELTTEPSSASAEESYENEEKLAEVTKEKDEEAEAEANVEVKFTLPITKKKSVDFALTEQIFTIPAREEDDSNQDEEQLIEVEESEANVEIELTLPLAKRNSVDSNQESSIETNERKEESIEPTKEEYDDIDEAEDEKEIKQTITVNENESKYDNNEDDEQQIEAGEPETNVEIELTLPLVKRSSVDSDQNSLTESNENKVLLPMEEAQEKEESIESTKEEYDDKSDDAEDEKEQEIKQTPTVNKSVAKYDNDKDEEQQIETEEPEANVEIELVLPLAKRNLVDDQESSTEFNESNVLLPREEAQEKEESTEPTKEEYDDKIDDAEDEKEQEIKQTLTVNENEAKSDINKDEEAEEPEANVEIEFTLPIAKKNSVDFDKFEEERVMDIELDDNVEVQFSLPIAKRKSTDSIQKENETFESISTEQNSNQPLEKNDNEADVEIAFTLPIASQISVNANERVNEIIDEGLITLVEDKALDSELEEEQVIEQPIQKEANVEVETNAEADVEMAFTLPIIKKKVIDPQEVSNEFCEDKALIPTNEEYEVEQNIEQQIDKDVEDEADMEVAFTLPISKKKSIDSTIEENKNNQDKTEHIVDAEIDSNIEAVLSLSIEEEINEATIEPCQYKKVTFMELEDSEEVNIKTPSNEEDNEADIEVAFTLPIVKKMSLDSNTIDNESIHTEEKETEHTDIKLTHSNQDQNSKQIDSSSETLEVNIEHNDKLLVKNENVDTLVDQIREKDPTQLQETDSKAKSDDELSKDTKENETELKDDKLQTSSILEPNDIEAKDMINATNEVDLDFAEVDMKFTNVEKNLSDPVGFYSIIQTDGDDDDEEENADDIDDEDVGIEFTVSLDKKTDSIAEQDLLKSQQFVEEAENTIQKSAEVELEPIEESQVTMAEVVEKDNLDVGVVIIPQTELEETIEEDLLSNLQDVDTFEVLEKPISEEVSQQNITEPAVGNSEELEEVASETNDSLLSSSGELIQKLDLPTIEENSSMESSALTILNNEPEDFKQERDLLDLVAEEKVKSTESKLYADNENPNEISLEAENKPSSNVEVEPEIMHAEEQQVSISEKEVLVEATTDNDLKSEATNSPTKELEEYAERTIEEMESKTEFHEPLVDTLESQVQKESNTQPMEKDQGQVNTVEEPEECKEELETPITPVVRSLNYDQPEVLVVASKSDASDEIINKSEESLALETVPATEEQSAEQLDREADKPNAYKEPSTIASENIEITQEEENTLHGKPQDATIDNEETMETQNQITDSKEIDLRKIESEIIPKDTSNSLETQSIPEIPEYSENIQVVLDSMSTRTEIPPENSVVIETTTSVVNETSEPIDFVETPIAALTISPNTPVENKNNIPILHDTQIQDNLPLDNIQQQQFDKNQTNNSNNYSAMSDDLNNDVASPSTDSGNGGSELNTTAATTDTSTTSTTTTAAATLVVNPNGNNAIACDAISNKLSEISEVAESLDAVIRDVQEDTDVLVETNSTGSSNDKKLENLRSNSSEDWHSRSTEDESFATASEGGNFTPYSHTSSSFQTASGRTSSFISSDKNYSFDASEADDSTFAFDIPDIPETLDVPHNHIHNISLDSSDHSFLSAQQTPSPPTITGQPNNRVHLIPIDIEPRSNPVEEVHNHYNNDNNNDDDDDDSVAGVEELHSQSVTPTPGDSHFESIPVESEHEWEYERSASTGASCIADAPSMEILTELTPLSTLSMTPEVSNNACPTNAYATTTDAFASSASASASASYSNQQGVNNAITTTNKPNAAWRRNKYYENITKQTIKGFL